MKIHELKIIKNFCDDILNGEKSFEIRENDRGYQKGDHIKFISIEANSGIRACHEIDKREYEITYVINGWGLKNGYVVFGIKEVSE